MACRGVHFAIEIATMERLVGAKSDAETLEIVQEDIEGRWDEAWLHETDKSWDALHRCLGNGTLDIPGGFAPLVAAVLGGEQRHSGAGFIVSLVRPEQVREVADALAQVTREWLRQRYDALNPNSYDGELGEDDFRYTWSWFEGLPDLYERAALDGRAVVFTVDQ